VETSRRRLLASACCGGLSLALPVLANERSLARRWHEAAEAMRAKALGWGDQSYGAVLVLNDAIIGEGPSRVVLNNDPTAHAEREAIRDAQRRLGRSLLPGSVLVSTSRPCAACEAAAAAAQVTRMIYGPALTDAGAPVGR
jgi:tRNA(adenine34) deaminase